MRLMLTAAVVVALVVVAAGCGGGKKASSTTPPTTTAAATTTTQATATTSSTTSSTSTTAAKPSFASAKNCQDLISLGAKISKAMTPTSGNVTANLANEANLLKALASAAPSEIRGDFQTFADAFTGYASALTKAGYKPGKVPTASQLTALASASKAFSAPKLQAAEKHLTAWSQKNCGGLTTGG